MLNKSNSWVLLVILLFLFWWFQQRPSEIRKTCAEAALEESVRLYPPYPNENTEYEPNTAKRTVLQQNLQEKEYRNCIAKNGLIE